MKILKTSILVIILFIAIIDCDNNSGMKKITGSRWVDFTAECVQIIPSAGFCFNGIEYNNKEQLNNFCVAHGYEYYYLKFTIYSDSLNCYISIGCCRRLD